MHATTLVGLVADWLSAWFQLWEAVRAPVPSVVIALPPQLLLLRFSADF
jgi:hypothetical protein